MLPRDDRRPRHGVAPVRTVPFLQRLHGGGLRRQELLALAFVGSATPACMSHASPRPAASTSPGASPTPSWATCAPTFGQGCKRLLITNDSYQALDHDDVDVVADAIVEVVPDGAHHNGTLHGSTPSCWARITTTSSSLR